MTSGLCKCGKSFIECKYPVSHNHPTVATIKLPGKVNAAVAGKRSAAYTAAQRAVMNDFQP